MACPRHPEASGSNDVGGNQLLHSCDTSFPARRPDAEASLRLLTTSPASHAFGASRLNRPRGAGNRRCYSRAFSSAPTIRGRTFLATRLMNGWSSDADVASCDHIGWSTPTTVMTDFTMVRIPMRSTSRARALGIVLVVGAACVPPSTQLGNVSADAVRAEQLKQQQLVLRTDVDFQQRLDDVAYPLLRAAVAMCSKSAGPMKGIRFANVHCESIRPVDRERCPDRRSHCGGVRRPAAPRLRGEHSTRFTLSVFQSYRLRVEARVAGRAGSSGVSGIPG